jgi:hypothetical protein
MHTISDDLSQLISLEEEEESMPRFPLPDTPSGYHQEERPRHGWLQFGEEEA